MDTDRHRQEQREYMDLECREVQKSLKDDVYQTVSTITSIKLTKKAKSWNFSASDRGQFAVNDLILG